MTTINTDRSTGRATEIVDALPLQQQIGLLMHPVVVINPDPDASSGFGDRACAN